MEIGGKGHSKRDDECHGQVVQLQSATSIARLLHLAPLRRPADAEAGSKKLRSIAFAAGHKHSALPDPRSPRGFSELRSKA